MAKAVGFIIMALGLIAIAISFPAIRAKSPVSIPAQITDMYLIIGGVVLLLLGGFMLRGSGGGKATPAGKELPIYQGNKLVGYRKV